MWIASVFGWFSVVKKDGGHCFRSRNKGDLQKLLLAAGVKKSVITKDNTDYRYRVILTSGEFGQTMKVLEASVEYPNFKSQIAKLPDQKSKLHAYHEIWRTMFEQGER